jgi:hypothetical protein
MNDRPLSIALILMFGVSGLVMLALAWMQPAAVSERVPAFVIGSVGLLVALARAMMLKKEGNGVKKADVKVENR